MFCIICAAHVFLIPKKTTKDYEWYLNWPHNLLHTAWAFYYQAIEPIGTHGLKVISISIPIYAGHQKNNLSSIVTGTVRIYTMMSKTNKFKLCKTEALVNLRLNHFLAFWDFGNWDNVRAKDSALAKAWIGLEYSVKYYIIFSNLFWRQYSLTVARRIPWRFWNDSTNMSNKPVHI